MLEGNTCLQLQQPGSFNKAMIILINSYNKYPYSDMFYLDQDQRILQIGVHAFYFRFILF